MKLRVAHRTLYRYASSVTVSHHEGRLMPRQTEWQRLLSHEVQIEPEPEIRRRRTDYFGNRALYFGMNEPHRELQVTAESIVVLAERPSEPIAATPQWEQVQKRLATDRRSDVLAASEMSYGSPLLPSPGLFRDLATPSFTPGRPVLEVARDLTRRIHAEFVYDPGATDVFTSAEQVLSRRRGVCQDFAHLAIACLRSLGLAARYVSGYLETLPRPGQEKLQGADESHAWFSVYLPDNGWVDFDPTNNQIPLDQHITTAWGRDFSDVTPLKGVIYGGDPGHQLRVAVDVERI